jgi:hypothetical protein
MHVEMRLRRAAAIADVTQDLAGADDVSDPGRHGSGAHMRIERVSARRDLDHEMIARGAIEVDRDGVTSLVWRVLRRAVRHGDNHAVGDAINWPIVAKITVVLVLRPFPGRGHAADRLNLNPVDGEALREVRASNRARAMAILPRAVKV